MYLEEEGLEDIRVHFLPRNNPWLQEVHTWSIHRSGRQVRSWTNYILGTEIHMFQNVAVRDARHNMDHYLVLG